MLNNLYKNGHTKVGQIKDNVLVENKKLQLLVHEIIYRHEQ